MMRNTQTWTVSIHFDLTKQQKSVGLFKLYPASDLVVTLNRVISFTGVTYRSAILVVHVNLYRVVKALTMIMTPGF